MSSYPPLQSANFESCTCVMWAVLALAELDELAPPDEATSEHVHSFLYRESLNSVCRAFVHSWNAINLSDRNFMVNRLATSIHQYYTSASPVDSQLQARYLVGLFMKFQGTLVGQHVEDASNPFDAERMLGALAWLMRRLTDAIVRDLLRTMNAIFLKFPEESSCDEELFPQVLSYTSAAALAIEYYIQSQTGRSANDNSGEQTGGWTISQRIREALHDHIYQAIEELVAGYNPGNPAFDDVENTEWNLSLCFRKMATIFSYTTPLLEEFRISDYDSDEDDDDMSDFGDDAHVPEHVNNHDFDKYEDNDWFAREYQLVDVQDVLRGPEYATLDDVSIAIRETEQPTCGICSDSTSPMRKIKVCVHTFCEECLVSQLDVEHECRYRCSSCRAEFFPRSSTRAS